MVTQPGLQDRGVMDPAVSSAGTVPLTPPMWNLAQCGYDDVAPRGRPGSSQSVAGSSSGTSHSAAATARVPRGVLLLRWALALRRVCACGAQHLTNSRSVYRHKPKLTFQIAAVPTASVLCIVVMQLYPSHVSTASGSHRFHYRNKANHTTNNTHITHTHTHQHTNDTL
jgi:hypothetical protein